MGTMTFLRPSPLSVLSTGTAQPLAAKEVITNLLIDVPVLTRSRQLLGRKRVRRTISSVPFSLAELHTFAALSRPVRLVNAGLREVMSLLTGIGSVSLSIGSFATQKVRPMRDCFQMFWVDARGFTTQVIKRERGFLDQCQVQNAVSEPPTIAVGSSKLPVSASIEGPDPDPAISVVDRDPRPETLRESVVMKCSHILHVNRVVQD